jgi:hypothetical protein
MPNLIGAPLNWLPEDPALLVELEPQPTSRQAAAAPTITTRVADTVSSPFLNGISREACCPPG